MTNPIDGTGAIYDDPTLLPKIFDALVDEPGRPVIAASVSARPVGRENMRRLARTIADAARNADRTFVAYSYSPLGGPLDPEIVSTLHSAGIPYLLGITNAMNVLKNLPLRRDLWRRALQGSAALKLTHTRWRAHSLCWRLDFMRAREALMAQASPCRDVVSPAPRRTRSRPSSVRGAVAIKAETPGLLHKSDLGCVRLDCASETRSSRPTGWSSAMRARRDSTMPMRSFSRW